MIPFAIKWILKPFGYFLLIAAFVVGGLLFSNRLSIGDITSAANNAWNLIERTSGSIPLIGQSGSGPAGMSDYDKMTEMAEKLKNGTVTVPVITTPAPVITVPVESKKDPPKPRIEKPTPGIVMFIGDSIGVRLRLNGLEQSFEGRDIGWSVLANAAESRALQNTVPSKNGKRPRNGYGQALAMRHGIADARAVVIQLGTNGDANQESAIRDMAERIHAHSNRSTRVYWVNVYDPRNEAETVRRNRLIEKASRSPKYGFTIINWHALASRPEHKGWFKDDPMRLHPSVGGARALINAIVDAVTRPQ